MVVEKTLKTSIDGTHGEKPDSEKIDQLNADFEEMGVPVRMIYEGSPDGWTITFIKEKRSNRG